MTRFRGGLTVRCAAAVIAVLLAGCTSQTAGDEQTRTGSQTGFIGGQS
jgi:hypothetical protein